MGTAASPIHNLKVRIAAPRQRLSAANNGRLYTPWRSQRHAHMSHSQRLYRSDETSIEGCRYQRLTIHSAQALWLLEVLRQPQGGRHMVVDSYTHRTMEAKPFCQQDSKAVKHYAVSQPKFQKGPYSHFALLV